jgi:hypothetical protein
MSTIKTNAIQTTAGKPILNSTGSILQVVRTIKTDTFSVANNTFTDVTGLSATITPTSTSNNILVIVALGAVGNGESGAATPHTSMFRIVRGATAIGVADVAGSRPQSNFRTSVALNSDHAHGYHYTILDSPSTTSSTTYKLQMATQSSSTGYINRTRNDTDGTDSYQSRASSSIILMEISG